jgi:tRNA A37 threonylcarbamoyladenosine modification protein TsaB
MILQLDCSQPIATLNLLNDDFVLVDSLEWEAHRALSTTLISKFEELMSRNGLPTPYPLCSLHFSEGPGSYTGLRVGGTFINTLASQLKIPVYGGRGEDWSLEAIARQKSSRPGLDLHYDKPLYAKLPTSIKSPRP